MRIRVPGTRLNLRSLDRTVPTLPGAVGQFVEVAGDDDGGGLDGGRIRVVRSDDAEHMDAGRQGQGVDLMRSRRTSSDSFGDFGDVLAD